MNILTEWQMKKITFLTVPFGAGRWLWGSESSMRTAFPYPSRWAVGLLRAGSVSLSHPCTGFQELNWGAFCCQNHISTAPSLNHWKGTGGLASCLVRNYRRKKNIPTCPNCLLLGSFVSLFLNGAESYSAFAETKKAGKCVWEWSQKPTRE